MKHKTNKRSFFLISFFSALFAVLVGGHFRVNFDKSASSLIENVHADIPCSSCGCPYSAADCASWLGGAGCGGDN